MIDTLIFLLVCLPLACTIVWYINETHEINLHKREMEQLWDLYAKESVLPGSEEPIKSTPKADWHSVGPIPHSEDTSRALLGKHKHPPDL